ncbi:MAG: 5,6-dimethylbenzimidazole synthase [Micromonosporaceae bacterium]|nr:5,6-dimethylbenzimidazole synthase [Micromonosporaceae bacterium]
MKSDIYDVIHRRRDVRAEFIGAQVADQTLRRVLAAAHAAPSVGLSQPWDFIIVRDRTILAAFHAHVQHERAVFAATLDGDPADRFARIKIDGVLESSCRS